MKKLQLVATLLFLLLQNISFAQKCNLQKDELDPFTKQKSRITKNINISIRPFWYIQFEQKDTTYTTTFWMREEGEVKLKMPAGTKIMVKLEDGTILSLVAEHDVVPMYDIGIGEISTKWIVVALLTKEELRKFSTSPIELIRTNISNKDINMPKALGNGVRKSMAGAACLLAEN